MDLKSLHSISANDFYGVVGGFRYNKENYTDNLLVLNKILKAHGVRFLLAFGTCLGAIRDKSFIDRDSDTDIMTTEEYEDALARTILSNEFKTLGFKVGRVMSDLVTVYRKTAYIDISVFRKKPRKDGRLSCLDRHTIEPYRFEKAQEIQFLGESFLVPAEPETYLAEKYGDWKVKSSKHAST